MKKIIVCSPQLGIAPQSNSGGEVYDREVIKALCEQGVKVIVILPWKKPYLKHKNLQVYYLSIPFVWPPYLFNLFIIPYLFWIYRKYKFNILRIHNPYFIGLGALFFKLFYPQIPLVVTYHHLEEGKPLFNLIDRSSIRFWEQIICVSQFTKKELLKKYKVNENKIAMIHNGVSEKFKIMKKDAILIKKYGLKDKRVLLFLGGLKKRKNINFLLKLIKQIDNTKVKLLICGQGRLKSILIKLTKKLKIKDRVIFAGFIPEEKKVDYYNLADIFLFPSRKEGFGMPIIEAGACGLPVIASNVSSLKELIINGKTGYLAELNNLNDWKNKVEQLLKNKIFRRKMGQSGQNFSQQFSWSKTASQQIEIYQKLINKES